MALQEVFVSSNLSLGLLCSPSEYSGMSNIISLTRVCLGDVKLDRHHAHFLGHVKGQSPISAQETSRYKVVPTVLELCGSLFV